MGTQHERKTTRNYEKFAWISVDPSSVEMGKARVCERSEVSEIFRDVKEMERGDVEVVKDDFLNLFNINLSI